MHAPTRNLEYGPGRMLVGCRSFVELDIWCLCFKGNRGMGHTVGSRFGVNCLGRESRQLLSCEGSHSS